MGTDIEKVVVTGVQFAQAASEFDATEVFPEMSNLQSAVLCALPGVASVLVKGSRFMKMEQVVQTVLDAQTDERSMAC